LKQFDFVLSDCIVLCIEKHAFLAHRVNMYTEKIQTWLSTCCWSADYSLEFLDRMKSMVSHFTTVLSILHITRIYLHC